jgi:hypothetical protein
VSLNVFLEVLLCIIDTALSMIAIFYSIE